jgi:hypothetical protein
MPDVSAGGYSRATWAGLGLLGAAVVVTLFFSTQIRSRAEQVADALEAAPPVAIADFPATGYARIEGRVRLPPSVLTAPLSGVRCAYYELEIELSDAARDALEDFPGARLRTSRRAGFELADATGTATVRLQNALVAVDDAHCRRGTLADLPDHRRGALAAEEDLGYLAGIDPAAVRLRECVLPADVAVAVAAAAAPGPASPGRLMLGTHGPIYVGAPPRRD